jgi:hypothetical protein
MDPTNSGEGRVIVTSGHDAHVAELVERVVVCAQAQTMMKVFFFDLEEI